MSKQQYDPAWLETLHREKGWVPDRFGFITGWRKPDNAASGTRFPFAQCVNDLDKHTVELYSDLCDSYHNAVALVHVTSDQLDEADKEVRGIIAGKPTVTDSNSLLRFLLRCCHFNAVFAAPPAEGAALGSWALPFPARREIWLAEGSSEVQRRAYDLCVLLLQNARESFLPYLLNRLQDTSDAWPTNGALNFVHKALQQDIIAVADVADTLLHLHSHQSLLPYGSQRLLDIRLKLLTVE